MIFQKTIYQKTELVFFKLKAFADDRISLHKRLKQKTLWEKEKMLVTSISPFPRVLCGSVVMCLTHNPGVLGSSCTLSSEFFRGSVPRQDTSEPQPSTGETQKDMNKLSCRRDITEIMLKTA